MNDILGRIELLRHGRAHHTWLGGCGVARNTIKAIKDEIAPPSERVLGNIARCENASYIWLTEGKGSPYRVARFDSDDECMDALSEYLSEEAWTVYWVIGKSMDMDSGEGPYLDTQKNGVVVLMQPSNFERSHGGVVEYTAIEVLSNAGLMTYSEASLNASVLKRITIDDDVLDAIANGQIGTFELFGDSKHEGILNDADIVGMTDRLSHYTLPNHSKPDSHDLTADEIELLTHYRTLSNENKPAVLQIMKNLK